MKSSDQQWNSFVSATDQLGAEMEVFARAMAQYHAALSANGFARPEASGFCANFQHTFLERHLQLRGGRPGGATDVPSPEDKP